MIKGENMYDLVKKAVNDMDSALEISRSKIDVNDVVDSINELSTNEAMKLGMNFKKFPLGCDLTEVIVGTCASDITKDELIANCILSNMLGASIHVCAYAFADIAQENNMNGIDLIKEVRSVTDVPIDLDHFGKFGPMRFPKEIVKCPGQCYLEGPPFEECPKDRIHSRLLEKEKLDLSDRDEWIKSSSSVAINLTSEQGGEDHAAPIEEAEEIAKLSKKFGKGLEAIMFIGDGYDDLITGFEKGLELGVDIFVLEGGPFNRSKSRLDSFAKAVAMARILVPGKIVATNGAYEDECRIGLRAGLNAIITGFPKNHHGYMCGYSPGTAKKGNFGLPRIVKMIKEELGPGLINIPIQRDELKAVARAVKILGPENVYPQMMGKSTIGDAHWAVMQNTPLYEAVGVEKTVHDIKNIVDGKTVAMLGGRFLSWGLAKELSKDFDEIVISDTDPWVEKVTVDTLNQELSSNVIRGRSDDVNSAKISDSTIITSTYPELVKKLSTKIDGSITLI